MVTNRAKLSPQIWTNLRLLWYKSKCEHKMYNEIEIDMYMIKII